MSKFCEMNGNINHIAEVSTSRKDGSPTGAKILTSTNVNTGDVRDTLDGRLDKISGVYIGEYKSGLVFNTYADYAIYNGQSYKPALSTQLPLTATNFDNDAEYLAVFDNSALCRQYESSSEYYANESKNFSVINWEQISSLASSRLIYKTHADLVADTTADKSKLAEVWHDTEENNGLYGFDGAWIKSLSDDCVNIKNYINTLFDVQPCVNSANVMTAFADVDGRMFAHFDNNGRLTALATDESKANFNYIDKNNYAEYVFAMTDAEDKVIFGIDKNGDQIPKQSKFTDVKNTTLAVTDAEDKVIVLVDEKGNLIDFSEAYKKNINESLFQRELYNYPIKTNAASYTRDVLQLRISLPTTAKGREGDSEIVLTDNGLAHPKVVYRPTGWNGFKYWMCFTPYFGTVGTKSQYENPTIMCSNDGVTWQEPVGITNPIDRPNNGDNSYWSDAHLVIGNDDWMYAFYRGNQFPDTGRPFVYKKSRDGVNWSDRYIVQQTIGSNKSNASADNLCMSPAWFKSVSSDYFCIDVLKSDANAIKWNDSNERKVFKRSNPLLTAEFGDYDTTQIVNYYGDIPENCSPWHIDAIKVGNTEIHLINYGLNSESAGEFLNLAVSTDGWNFKVLPTFAAGFANYYRSSITPISITDKTIELLAYIGNVGGVINVEKITIEMEQ